MHRARRHRRRVLERKALANRHDKGRAALVRGPAAAPAITDNLTRTAHDMARKVRKNTRPRATGAMRDQRENDRLAELGERTGDAIGANRTTRHHTPPSSSGRTRRLALSA